MPMITGENKANLQVEIYSVIRTFRADVGGTDMDRYAEDLATLIDHLNLKEAVLIGHSTGGGEVARYIGRFGSARVSKIVLVSAVPP